MTRPIIERLIGRGLPWAEGDDHKRQRYQLAPFFSSVFDFPGNHTNMVLTSNLLLRAQATSEMFEVIHTCSRIASDRLATYIKTTGNGKNSTRLDITDWTWRPTLDVIGRAAFDHDFECGESEDAKAIQLSWKHQVNAGLQKIGFVVSVPLNSRRSLPDFVQLYPTIGTSCFASVSFYRRPAIRVHSGPRRSENYFTKNRSVDD